jgi:hypothetical protein
MLMQEDSVLVTPEHSDKKPYAAIIKVRETCRTYVSNKFYSFCYALPFYVRICVHLRTEI